MHKIFTNSPDNWNFASLMIFPFSNGYSEIKPEQKTRTQIVYHNIIYILAYQLLILAQYRHTDRAEPTTNYQNKYYSVNDWKAKHIVSE